tara:strand:+ start:167 stop:340 length:174 start_codon:yes stop_codon:yes gene_type:complete
MVDSITNLQLEKALQFLYSPTTSKLPEILRSLTPTQWAAVELLATQLEEERTVATLH